jgi:hypothetical protein
MMDEKNGSTSVAFKDSQESLGMSVGKIWEWNGIGEYRDYFFAVCINAHQVLFGLYLELFTVLLGSFCYIDSR